MKLVLIEWVDSHGPVEGWRVLEGELRPEVLKCKSVGWLIHDGEDCKIVVPHIAGDESDGIPFQGRGDLTIPCRSITALKELK
jgi:hypothetical protein